MKEERGKVGHKINMVCIVLILVSMLCSVFLSPLSGLIVLVISLVASSYSVKI